MELVDDEFKVKVIDPFYKNQRFNELVSNDILKTVNNPQEYNLIFSAHGLPQKIVDAGDPYEKHVNEQVEIQKQLFKEKGIEFESINLAYQSKVGPMKWLTPSLDDKLKEFEGKNVIIYPIAFIIDNSETKFELDIEYLEIAEELKVKDYKVVPCVNDSEEFIKVIKELISS